MHKLVSLMHAIVCKGVAFNPRFSHLAIDVQDGI
jgi:hypothetical protein